MNVFVKNFIVDIKRWLWNIKRKSQIKDNIAKEQTLNSFEIREAVFEDIPALTSLHVKAWNETYWNVKDTPTYQTREWQWQEQFKQPASKWFCYVVVNSDKDLVGFAKGKTYSHANLPDYDGEFNKLYLLLAYQRLGLGRKLFCKVIKRFLSMGISSIVLFGEPHNPSCHFHKKMGGKRLYAPNGEFHGGFGWTDLTAITALCK